MSENLEALGTPVADPTPENPDKEPPVIGQPNATERKETAAAPTKEEIPKTVLDTDTRPTAAERGTETPLLVCSHLYKSYDKPLFTDFNLSLPAGKIIGLLGPNGSGKTTLIKMAAGLLTYQSGSLTIAGHAPGPITKTFVSYLPERNSLPEWMTGEELIEFFSEFFEDFDPALATNMLNDLHVDLTKRIRTLSKGTKEKVQLVLVMSRRARLYLLDEPIAGVDPATRDYILNTIIRGYHAEATVLISTHLISDVENYLDDFLFLLNGKVVRSGNVATYRAAVGMSLDESFRREFRC